MVAWAVVVIVIVAAALLLRRLGRDRGDLDKLPLAKGTKPFVGCAPLIQSASAGKIHKGWEAIIDEAGDAPLVRASILGSALIVATTPEAHDVITRKHKFIPKMRAVYEGFKGLGISADMLIIMEDAAEHTRVRKELGVFFSNENIQAVIKQLTTLMQAACADAAAAADQTSDGAAHIDVMALANTIIDNVVRGVFFETEIKVNYAAFTDAFAQMGEIQAQVVAMLNAKYGFGSAHKRYRRNWADLRASWEALMTETYSKPMQAESRAFWACLRRAYPDAMTDKGQYEGALAHLALMYGAGSETTINAISMTMGVLACEPSTTQRLEQELEDAGLLATEANPNPRAPTAKDLFDLTYLDAVFHEGLRFMPPAPSGTVRCLQDETVLNGYRIPKGSNVILPPWAFHRSRAIWGEDAKEWRPERWLEGRSINAAKKDAAGFLRWVPFSDGRQNCIGQHLATIETKLAVATLVSNFRIAPDPKTMPCKSAAEFADSLSTHVTLRRDAGVWLNMTPRVHSQKSSTG